ncbi:hypothetical protein R1sor_015582 [Riccia sorocarpa]|uniref:protein-serine/threonine phosphatase n=1 Tax=Riccia sorocarpa TaxID=122646 RepID=A0ABD3HD15_9MARC
MRFHSNIGVFATGGKTSMETLQQMHAQLQEEKKEVRDGIDEAQWKCGSGESKHLQPQALYGCALLPNTRGHEMEDFHRAEFREIGHGNEIGLFGIFDSHRGPHVGREVQRRLFDNILNEGGVWFDPAGATRDGYLLTDRQLLDGLSKEVELAGCTAVTAMLFEHGARLLVANVGDSRAVLCKNGDAVQLSVDHDPGRPVERANVEMRGGVVVTLPGDVPRVDGQLAVARAFGDKSLKAHMSAKPDMEDLLVDLSCQFLILASNGLWRVISNQEAVDLVQDIMDPAEAAKALVRQARERLNDDDISCIVIRFMEV